MYNICETSYVQRAWRENGGSLSRADLLNPAVHGWVYDLTTGLVKDLNVDVRNLNKLHVIDFEESRKSDD